MLEKRGDFQIGKSKTDFGSGKTAEVAPKDIGDSVLPVETESTGNPLEKKAELSKQAVVRLEELLGERKKGKADKKA